MVAQIISALFVIRLPFLARSDVACARNGKFLASEEELRRRVMIMFRA
jgi:hypothetical protein